MSSWFRLFLFGGIILCSSGALLAQSSDRKKLDKKKKKFWKKEMRAANSTNHESVRATYPEIGWLSGLWCLEGSEDPIKRFEIQGPNKLREVTRGFLGVSDMTVIKPDQFLYMSKEVNGKKVVINNENHYDLWTCSGGKNSAAYGREVWYVYLSRLRKIADNQIEWVYSDSFTIQEEGFSCTNFFTAQSPLIPAIRHRKDPVVYVKCN